VQPYIVNTTRDSTYNLDALGYGGTVLRVPISDTEYLLVEYREGGAGDRRLPGSGVLIYHIAEHLPLRPNVPTGSYRVSLVEADDDSSLFRTEFAGGNRGTASDAFGVTRFSYISGEHTRAKAVDGSPLPFSITEISLNPAQHRASLRIAPGVLSPR
jgi:immune inhibitor A